MVWKNVTKFDIFKMSHKPVDTYAYWKQIEGIDQYIKKRN